MIKNVLSVALACALASTASLAASPQKKAPAKQAKTQLTQEEILAKVAELPVSKSHSFVPEEVRDGGGTYLIKGHFTTPNGPVSTYEYVTKDFSTVILGQAYSSVTGAPYSQFDAAQLRAGGAFTVGNGPAEIVIVTDPLCPYCKRLEIQLEKYKELITAHIVLVSLPMHPEAPNAIRYILSKESDADRFSALLEIANNKEDYKTFKPQDGEKSKAKMAAMENLSKALRVTGTPSIFGIDGMAIPMQFFAYLEQELKQKEASNAPITPQ